MALTLTPAVFGQTFYGSIVGNVTDASGGAVTGAHVTLTNNSTNEKRTADTSADGVYRFVNLNPGNYRLETEQQGFKKDTRPSIQLEVAANIRLDIALQVGDATQTVEVTGEVPLIQTENATLSQVVDSKTVEQLPLNGRNVLNLVALAPGVVPQGGAMGNLQGQNIFAAGNFQIGGGQANQSASYLDGAPLNVNYGNLTPLVPTQEVVSEFRVQTSNNTAEFGRYTGGVVNLITKSGTNEFHGSAYEFLRNRALNASSFFANANKTGKPAYAQNQFGASIGGPIRKDKTFFFATYEGYRQRSANTFTATVPIAPFYNGDFSGYKNAAGAVIPIYDPLTTCGTRTNAACAAGQTVLRQQFTGNIIPPSRFDPVANYMKDKLFGAPNTAANPFTNLQNFSYNTPTGGDNDQGNIRVDHAIGEKQHLFARYTQWNLHNIGGDAYPQTPYYAGGSNPENFTTYQATLGDTYTISPTWVADFRAAFLRFDYDRNLKTPTGSLDLTTIGLPAYFKSVVLSTYPTFNFGTDYSAGGGQRISSKNNSYSLSANLSKFAGKHQLKFGGELRRVDANFFQVNSPGGTYTFSNLFTSQNAQNPGASGNSFASFLLGNPASGNINLANITASNMYYQGYYVTDTWQTTSKLTMTLGLRWEIPGVWRERHDNIATFNPTEVNPLVQLNGNPVLGAFDLVNSMQHPERGQNPEKFYLFAPRIGVSYRVDNNTVIRAGAGIFYTPADAIFVESPYQNAVNIAPNTMVSTLDNQQSPAAVLSNPYPNGLFTPPGRSPNYQQSLLGVTFNSTSGGANSAIIENHRQPYMLQWNFGIQRQLLGGAALEVAYLGSRGVHLPTSVTQLNQLPDQYLSLGTKLLQLVPNPFQSVVTSGGPLSQATVQQGQLLRPFPQYQNVVDAGGYIGNSTYNALTLRLNKRFAKGGTIIGSYTFSKIMSDVETGTPWLESGGTAGYQDYNNMKLEKALSSFDSRQRLVISYVLDLPFGGGRHYLGNAKGFFGGMVSGWGVNGVSTFQEGFPVNITFTPNLTNSFGGGSRPNVISGCDRTLDGAIQQRLRGYFNTACFTPPAAYTFGNESRTDSAIRSPGQANYDFALFKRTTFRERYGIEFRAEVFNLFNRVQFARPNTAMTTAANSTFGWITSQANQPRLMQLALRFTY